MKVIAERARGPAPSCLTTRNSWHVVALASTITHRSATWTLLCDLRIRIKRAADGTLTANGTGFGALPVCERYGYVWVSLGKPPSTPLLIPELNEPDRRTVHVGGFGVHTSAPRAIENFFDLAHLPFVHSGTLGIEPFTEILTYHVKTTLNEGIIATHCRIYQPQSGLNASAGFVVEYLWRVLQPFCSVLLKANPRFPDRVDLVGIFVQPLDEERIVAHLFVSVIDDENSDEAIRAFNQSIFSQDKPILESQRPKKLPLNLRAELPVRADSLSTAYRRWLKALDVSYGTISQ